MNTIDEAMIAILEQRLKLSKLSYSDENYDDVEELLHDLEDDFNEKYGDKYEGKYPPEKKVKTDFFKPKNFKHEIDE